MPFSWSPHKSQERSPFNNHINIGYILYQSLFFFLKIFRIDFASSHSNIGFSSLCISSFQSVRYISFSLCSVLIWVFFLKKVVVVNLVYRVWFDWRFTKESFVQELGFSDWNIFILVSVLLLICVYLFACDYVIVVWINCLFCLVYCED